MRMDRRELLVAAGSAMLAGKAEKVFAGPFSVQEVQGLVPEDKKLDPAWVKSLTERGEPETVRWEPQYSHVGMPIGGCFAGTVYLGANGRLWNWDVMNEHHQGTVARPNVTFWGESVSVGGGANYLDPPKQQAPFWVDFLIDGQPIDERTFGSITFRGEYPMGRVSYADGLDGLEVELEAYSPFVPLEIEKSSWPATVMEYTIRNTGDEDRVITFGGRADHPAQSVPDMEKWFGLEVGEIGDDSWRGFFAGVNEIGRASRKEDIVLSHWQDGTFGGWTTTGTAFGKGPRRVSEIADYQGDLGAVGEWVVNTHNTANGEDVIQADVHVGTLTSPDFQVDRPYLRFLLGGGNHPGKTGVEVWIGDKKVREATGRNSNHMHREVFDLREFAGQTARIVVRDEESGGWGQVGVDDVRLSDLEFSPEEVAGHRANGSLAVMVEASSDVNTALGGDSRGGEVSCKWTVPAKGSIKIRTIVSWFYPNLHIPDFPGKKRWYASKWKDAKDVALSLAGELDELSELTKRWTSTWYHESTLPYWLLDRSFLSTCILATNTCHRFDDGRYWFWEGIGCCHGTCTHVWSYAQSAARVFPEVERRLREEVDFGLAFHEDTGAIDYRGEFARSVAIDGQCGCILRTYREHLGSKDIAFLTRLWPKVKRAMEYVIGRDPDGDGILEGAQYNTLDTDWYGEISWLSSLYVAALRASAEMATVMGDSGFASRCTDLADKGGTYLVDNLFDGEYFYHKVDPAHPETNATGIGCHLDQLYGQSWAHQVGLDKRVVRERESESALKAMYKYNFSPDVGVYRSKMKEVKGGRWYAAPGEAGLIMTTFPKGGAERATGKGRDEWAAMYFNECWTGYEFHVAGHMIWEGLVEEGLAVARAVHDRHSPDKRNPYNEIECSDHYGRSMSSYGVFVAACGFKLNGPKGEMSVSPRVENGSEFRAPFISHEGWGTVVIRGDRSEFEYKHKV